jgi:hypothetical protein
MRTVEIKLLTGQKVVGTYLTIVTYPHELKDARYTATWEIRVGTYEFAPITQHSHFSAEIRNRHRNTDLRHGRWIIRWEISMRRLDIL